MERKPSKNSGSTRESLLRTGKDWWNNACLSKWSDNWSVYARGYRRAADILVEHMDGHQRDQDTIVFPIIFLYRQYIELRLKHLDRTACDLLEEDFRLASTHKLGPLWRTLRRHIEAIEMEFGKMGDRSVLDEAENTVLALGDLDPAGMTFRYPESLKGESIVPKVSHINVRHFREQIENVCQLLEGVDSQLGVLTDMKNEWLSTMER